MSDASFRDLDVVHALPAVSSRGARFALAALRWGILLTVVVVLAVQGYVLATEGLLP